MTLGKIFFTHFYALQLQYIIFRDEATEDLNTEYKPIEFVTDVGLPTSLSSLSV